MMIAYEFAAHISEAGYVEIPAEYAEQLPPGSAIRVLILTEGETNIANTTAHYYQHDARPIASYQNQQATTLDKLIATVKGKPSNVEHIQLGSGNLIKHLSTSMTEADADFDALAWEQEWASIEAQMKAASLAHEHTERDEWLK